MPVGPGSRGKPARSISRVGSKPAADGPHTCRSLTCGTLRDAEVSHGQGRRTTRCARFSAARAIEGAIWRHASVPVRQGHRLESLHLRPWPTNAEGSLALPLGKVGREVTPEQAYASARLTALAILGSLKRGLGDLDRICAWNRVFGMVSLAPGFNRQPGVINGFSDLIIEVFGSSIGAHSRSAVGMAELPFDIPVEIEAEVEFRG